MKRGNPLPSAVFLSFSILWTPLFLQARPPKKHIVPNSWELIARSLKGSPVPYQGKMELTTLSHLSSASFVTSIRFAPPHFYRREVFGPDGKVKEIAVLNDKEEWIYRRDTKKYWKMPPPDSLDDQKELETLKANYEVSSPKASHAAGRRAFSVKLFSKEKHSLSRIFWLDPKYGVILKTEIYDDSGRLKSKSSFERIRFFVKKPVPKKWFAFKPPKKSHPAQESLDISLQSAKKKFGIAPLTPSWLPFGYALDHIRTLNHQGRPVIQEEFSDGINAVSLFEYKDIGSKISGEKISLKNGATAYFTPTSEGKTLTWEKKPLRLVLVSSLATEKLIRIANSMP